MKLKTELFYILRLLNPRYTPVCRFNLRHYYSYFKNRFFGLKLLKKLSPYYNNEITDDLEIHILCSKMDLYMCAWALRSFLYYSELNPKIIIYNDGSIEKKYADLLESKFNNLTVLKIPDIIGEPDIIDKYIKKGHPLMKKLIGPFYTAKADNVIVMDSDVLFFKKPQEIIDFIDQDKVKSLVSGGLKNGEKEISSGFMILKKEVLNINILVEYLINQPKKMDDYFVEQNGWDYIIRQTKFEFLPLNTYKIKYPPDSNTIMKHFTTPRRHELYAWGIEKLKKDMNYVPL